MCWADWPGFGWVVGQGAGWIAWAGWQGSNATLGLVGRVPKPVVYIKLLENDWRFG